MNNKNRSNQPAKFSVFEFEPSEFSEQFAAKGYVHIPGGASPEFMRYAIHFAKSRLDRCGDKNLADWQIRGKKRQYLMEFPDNCDYPEGLVRAVATLAGVDSERMMLSERHIKVYERNAPAEPPPHKDRLASQFTLSVGLHIPEDSRLILYPDREFVVNPFQSAKQWRDSLDAPDLPENVLAGVEPVEIDLRPGDVVMFAGNSVYHERRNPANAWLLSMKWNAMRLDPLAEDPRTAPLREHSLALLHGNTDEVLLDMRIEVSPRLERVSRHYTRLHWQEVIQGSIHGEREFNLSEVELGALRALDDRIIAVRDLIQRMGFPAQRAVGYVPMLRRLVEVGAMELHG